MKFCVIINARPPMELKSKGRLVLLGRSIHAQPFDHFTGHFVYIIIVISFNFKVVIRAVIEADGSIMLYDIAVFSKRC